MCAVDRNLWVVSVCFVIYQSLTDLRNNQNPLLNYRILINIKY